ncbi:hypothetical protein [Muriicola sp. Z0-33]|uniref:hypothetical protein n=1 Tax=Muriicola sp. Z0-33 TaxID=2816957 RepID=UPI002237E092|nr:hypothetical protein [Muriicola sp. Z0-33]MCW5516885.1 hypothetical protein [Muriicola sp. Z0-33]
MENELNKHNWLWVLLLLMLPSIGFAQILMDQGVRVKGLWCFPAKDDPNAYYYLPAESNLGMAGNKPQFSYMRYVDMEAEKSENGNSILQAKGGGVLHFLVLYETSEAQLENTRDELAYVTGNNKARLKGPVIFKEGTYALVSSIIDPEEGGQRRKLMIKGRAPVLEGNKIALSFELNAKDSKLLFESFKMATPDISLVFDLTFEGLSNAYDATLEIDWSEVQKRHEAQVAGGYMFIGAQAGLELDDLMKNQSIKLTTNGEDEQMDQMMNTVLDKLLGMLFDPVAENNEENDNPLTEMLSQIMSSSGEKKEPGFATSGFGFQASYKYKEIKKSGKSTVNFNSRSTVERHHFIAFNIGNLYKKYGNDKSIFNIIIIDDDAFQLREVRIGIDGTLYQEFDKMVNNVTVLVRKKHQNEEETIRSLVVNKLQFDQNNAEPFSLTYGSKGDEDRLKWLDYDYKTIWQFQGGASYETDWQMASASMINLYSPFERTSIQLSGDMDQLLEQGYRAVVVQLEYPFFGKKMNPQKLLKPGDDLDQNAFEVTLPLSNREYKYTMTWIGNNGNRLTNNNTDSSGIIFVDELPEN